MNLKAQLLTSLVTLMLYHNAISQATFANNLTGANRFLGFSGAQNLEFRTDNITRMTLTQTTGRLGIGTAGPLSMLNIRTNATGDFFRSDGPTNLDNRWQLATGGTERFRIRNLSNPNGFDTYLERTDPNGSADIRFLTADVQIRARGKRLGDFCEFNGAIPDIVQFGDGTDVNTFIHSTNSRGASFWGNNGNVRIGSLYASQSNPNVQLDIVAQELFQAPGSDLQTGDVILQARMSADTVNFLRIQSGSTINDVFTPTILGYNANTETVAPAVTIAAKISNDTDVTTSNQAVFEFDARAGTPTSSNAIVNRKAFRWCNFNQEFMTMRASGRMGINNTVPLNRLEINSALNDPYFTVDNLIPGEIGSSGLKFSRMNALSLPVDAIGQGVLSLDSTGNVIYVNINSIEPICEWNLVNAEDLATGYPGACREGNVAIGESQIFQDTKLRVVHAANEPFVFGQRNRSTGASNTGVGIESFAFGQSGAWVAGVQGTATGSISKNFGRYFEGITPQDGTGSAGCVGLSVAQECESENIGVFGIAAFGENLFGIKGSVQAGACTDNMYGVYGETVGTASNQTWAIYANGAAGGITNWNLSDENLKQNIQPLANGLETIMALQPSSYEFRAEEFQQLALPTDTHFGLLASNVQEVMPTLVREAYLPQRTDLNGNVVHEELNFRMVNYTEVIPVLVKAVQEQQEQIAQLTAMVNECCGFTTAARGASDTEENLAQSDVTLSNEGNIVLNQNVPNPFAERTSIDYEINQPFQKAQILFHDQSGKLIQVADIFQQGKGRLNVFADDLSTGTYTYSLFVDGAIISSHKMVKQ
jgi:hypothetical protein